MTLRGHFDLSVYHTLYHTSQVKLGRIRSLDIYQRKIFGKIRDLAIVEISSVCKVFSIGGAYEARTRDLLTASHYMFSVFSMVQLCCTTTCTTSEVVQFFVHYI